MKQGFASAIDVDVSLKRTYVDQGPPAPGQPVRAQITLEPDELGPALLPDLEAITITNSLAQGYQTATLHVAPNPVFGPDRSWADVVRPYSLLGISIHRKGTSDDPATTAAPEPVFMGLIDYPSVAEDYSQAEPRREQQLCGRSMAAVLHDHRWWFHWYLVGTTEWPAQIPPDFRQFYKVPPDLRLFRDEQQIRMLGFFAIDPSMYKDAVERHPAEAMRLTWNFFVGTESRPGFIKLRFSDGTGIRDRLRFDSDFARQNFVDPAARLNRQVLPTEMKNANCWQILRLFAQEPLLELFSDTFGTSLADAAVEVYVRKPPFNGQIIRTDQGTRVDFSTGSYPRAGESLFDGAFGTWDRDTDTIQITDDDLLAKPSLRRGIDGPIWTTYSVIPALSGIAGNAMGDRLLQRNFAPLIEEDLDSPSYVLRYGNRVLMLTPNFIPILEVDGETPEVASARDVCLAYQVLLRTWFYRLPELWRGVYQVRGRTAFRVGRRLLHTRTDGRKREFYIVGTTHHVMLGERPEFTTVLQVERGRDLS
jgi:hypothetical protein